MVHCLLLREEMRVAAAELCHVRLPGLLLLVPHEPPCPLVPRVKRPHGGGHDPSLARPHGAVELGEVQLAAVARYFRCHRPNWKLPIQCFLRVLQSCIFAAHVPHSRCHMLCYFFYRGGGGECQLRAELGGVVWGLIRATGSGGERTRSSVVARQRESVPKHTVTKFALRCVASKNGGRSS